MIKCQISFLISVTPSLKKDLKNLELILFVRIFVLFNVLYKF